MKNNILITGCGGFIGSNFVALLVKEGYKVYGIDLEVEGFDPDAIEELQSKYSKFQFQYEKLDINNIVSISRICEDYNIDWIINFAAYSHVDTSINNARPFVKSNVMGTLSLLDVCKKQNINLFHISSDEVYGSTNKGEEFVEESKLNPKNPYSATKAAAEHLVNSYHNTFNVQYKMIRMSNNFGPYQDSKKFIPTILKSIKEGKKIPIYGKGNQIRDWVYVKDSCQYILEVLERGDMNQTYNITNKNEMKNVDLVKKILSFHGLSFEKNVEFVEDRKGHDFRYAITNDKLMKLMNGKKIETNFDEALKETIEWYKREKELITMLEEGLKSSTSTHDLGSFAKYAKGNDK